MSATRDALLVGCSDYEDSEFPQLQAPAQDLDALERVLADPTIGNFTVQPLLNKPSGAVRERIERFFANRKPDDLLLLYFSCHGDLDLRRRLYFVAANTKKELPESTGITAEWVEKQMDQSRSQRIVLLLDCCHSGAFATRGNGSKEILEQVRQLGGRGRVAITASGKAEQAYGSRFTNAVVQGLKPGRLTSTVTARYRSMSCINTCATRSPRASRAKRRQCGDGWKAGSIWRIIPVRYCHCRPNSNQP